MKFTDKLKELRESHDLTQRQIAVGLEMDVARSTIAMKKASVT